MEDSKGKSVGQKADAVAVEVEEEEDAATLQFPKEFREKAEPLSISEVSLLLKYRKQMNEKDEDDTELSRVFHSTLDYTTKFAIFKHRLIINQVRGLMMSRDLRLAAPSGRGAGLENDPSNDVQRLHKFEAACLANLTPDNGDEACALIRSLGRFDTSDLDQLCDDIKTQKSFQATSVDIDDAMES